MVAHDHELHSFGCGLLARSLVGRTDGRRVDRGRHAPPHFHLPSFGEENPFLTLISLSSLSSLSLRPSFPSLLIYVTDMMSSAELDGRCVGELGGRQRGREVGAPVIRYADVEC